PEGCELQKVQELFNPCGEGWNIELLRRLFSEEEVNAIKQVPVSSLGVQDRLVWCHTKNGQYSVSSGYKAIMCDRKKEEEGVGSSNMNENEEKKMWNKIWGLQVKNKIKHFIWKAVYDRLPVGKNLGRRGLKGVEHCHLCGAETETTEHVFFHCPTAKKIWKLSPVSWDGLETHTHSFKDWWNAQAKMGQQNMIQDRQDLTVYILWQIWRNRNEWCFSETRRHEKEVVQRAWEEWMEFKEAQAEKTRISNKPILVRTRVRWTVPGPGIVKINVGTAEDRSKESSGIGIIARGEAGNIMLAMIVTRDSSLNPVVTELEATRLALILAHQNRWSKVEM
ncbi:hypothetical protein, partial [Candidatus Burkholderia verschuerenii]|uniref:hypothetical protein n=1 Tax=Candidatus Burkholderia verschuerenii TaxID=242163 RepID=UPI000AF2379F